MLYIHVHIHTTYLHVVLIKVFFLFVCIFFFKYSKTGFYYVAHDGFTVTFHSFLVSASSVLGLEVCFTILAPYVV